MTKKTYRTAQGRTVDLGALILANENVRAVGNMGVNARGDKINEYNRSIADRTKQVKKQYDSQVSTNVRDDRPSEHSMGNRPAAAKAPVSAPATKIKPAEVRTETTPAPASASIGVAAALDKVKKIKQQKG